MHTLINTSRPSIWLVCAFIIGLAGCSNGTDIESDLGIDDAPEWVNEGTNAVSDDDGRLLQGVGMAMAMNNISLQKSTADNRARAEIGRILSTLMDNSMQDYAASNGSSSSNTIERELSSISKASLSGSKIIARWKNQENGDIYSFAELDLDKVEQLVEKSATMNQEYKAFFNTYLDTNFDRFIQTKKSK